MESENRRFYLDLLADKEEDETYCCMRSVAEMTLMNRDEA